jgi:hypothetical protein
VKILHILRSEPDEMVRQLIRKMSQAEGGREVRLHGGPVDYDQLVRDVFQSDRVICWW